jgi:hypothetical protein
MIGDRIEDMIAYMPLPDKRLKERLGQLVELFSKQPDQSIPQMCGGWETTKAAYRFMDNERVSHKALLEGQRKGSWEAIRREGHETILVVQDTTSFDFSRHTETAGLGPLENAYRRGFLVHSSLAVSTAGVPMGLVSQQVWVRRAEETGKRQRRKERLLEDKESYKWIQGLPDLGAETAGIRQIIVADRESDIYEVFQAASAQRDFVIRAARNRAVPASAQGYLFETVRASPVQYRYRLHVQGTPTRQERQAEVSLRFTQVTLRPPKRPTSSPRLEPLTVGVIEVLEEAPPLGQTPIRWLLLTSLPLEQVEQACQYVLYYSYRWLIERFHFILKSGCRLEERQLKLQSRLQRLLGVFSLVAWRLLWLTYQARLTPDVPCTLALTASEWQALSAYMQHAATPSATPPSLHQAVGWIAQLGGFLARRGDGEPGVKVLWRGWQRLQDITQTWLLFHPSPTYG